MKKGFALLFLTFLFTAVPSVIHAQAILKPIDTTKSVLTKVENTANQIGVPNLVNNISNQQTAVKITSNEDEQKVDISLPEVGNVNINLHSKEQADSASGEEIQNSQKGILTTDLSNPVLGTTHLGVGEVTNTAASGLAESNAGFITVGIDNPIVGDNHIGVLDSIQMETPSGRSVSGGVIALDTKNSPIGDAHLGVGEVKKTETSATQQISSGLINVTIQSPIAGYQIGILQTQQKETSDSKTASGGLVVIDIKNSPLGDVHFGAGDGTKTETPAYADIGLGFLNVELDNPIKGNTFTSVLESLQKETDEGIIVSGRMNVIDNKGSPLMDKLNGTDESNLKNQKDSTGDIPSNSPVQVTTPSGPSASGSSSGGTGGSSASSGGFGMNIYIGNEYQKEMALENHVQSVLKELSDEWIEAPPIKPPKSSFFLSK